jgi:hypothetical protein
MKTLSIFAAALTFAACGAQDMPEKCGAQYVDAALISATLAQDCPETSLKADAACIGDGPCTSLCRQSSVQLDFASHDLMALKVAIKEVRLIDPATEQVLEKLKFRDPQQWNGEQYTGWNEELGAGVNLKTTYKLSAPSFSSFASGRLYEKTYRVEVDVEIDGQLRTLKVDAQREPEVVT